MRLLLGTRRPDERRKRETERLKALMRRLHALPDDAALAINEILCADPSCPGDETVILLMRPGRKTQAFKLPGTLAEIGESEIAALRLAP